MGPEVPRWGNRGPLARRRPLMEAETATATAAARGVAGEEGGPMATRPVLVGVDGSEESLRAVEWAARQAKRHGSPLRIVSAPAMPPRMRAQVDPATVANALRGMSA